MFKRILFTTVAAAALLTAAPALAAEGKIEKPCSCCSDGSIHDVDHPLREGKAQKASGTKSAPAASDELNARNRSFGG